MNVSLPTMVGRIQGGNFSQKGTRVFSQWMKVKRINNLLGQLCFSVNPGFQDDAYPA